MSNFLSLFKIACINYTPNPVSYQDKAINRQELVSLQKVVSDLAIEGIEATETELAAGSELEEELDREVPAAHRAGTAI